MDNFLLCIEYAEKTDDKQQQANAYQNIATLYILQKEYNKAASSLDRAAKLYRALGDDDGVLITLFNFANILKDAVSGRKLIRARAYVVTTESGEESPFFEALEKMGIEIKTKDLQVFYGGAKKADWDVGLAIDAIQMAPKLDAVVIVSGDGDFVPLVEYLQTSMGCQVEIISFGKSSSGRIKEVADDFLDLDENPKKYLIQSAKRRIPFIQNSD